MKYVLVKAFLLLGVVGFMLQTDAMVSSQARQTQKYELEKIACLRGCLTKCKQDEPLLSCQDCQFMCVPRARINKKIIPIQSLAHAKSST